MIELQEKHQELRISTREICEYDMKLDSQKLDQIFEEKFSGVVEDLQYERKSITPLKIANEIKERYFGD